jgi:hypothetical protein
LEAPTVGCGRSSAYAQAEVFGGRSDGKSGVLREEVLYFQLLIRASDDRVGVTRPRRFLIFARSFAAVNPEFMGKSGKNPPPGARWGNASLSSSLALICNPDTEFCMIDL